MITAPKLTDHLMECDYGLQMCIRGGADCGGVGKGIYVRKDWKVHDEEVCENHS